MNISHGNIELKTFDHKGRGLVALQHFTKDALIERAPVLVVPAVQFETISNEKNNLGPLKSHMIIWKQMDNSDKFIAAIAFGALSFCNHDDEPNAYFKIDHSAELVSLIALSNITKGAEITIKYRQPEIINIKNWD